MNKFKCLILIDDSVFLQHIIGLIVILCNKGVKPSILIDDFVNKELVAYQLISSLCKDKEIEILLFNKDEYSSRVLKFDYIVTQWGPPKSIGRFFSKVKRNNLLHSITLCGGRIFSFPHGFEIKDVCLSISWKARLRALLCDLSFNPFKDYSRFYERYFFETDFHMRRYKRYMDEKFSGVIGFPTFNPYSLHEINKKLIKYGIQSKPVFGKVLIMPKFRHIGTKRIDVLNDVDYVIPHPREYELQYKFLKEKFPRVKIISTLDFFSLGVHSHIIDFGTSVSILGKLFGATVTYINLLSHEPFFNESDFIGLVDTKFFSCGFDSYDSYATYVISEIMANDYE